MAGVGAGVKGQKDGEMRKENIRQQRKRMRYRIGRAERGEVAK